MIKNFFSEISNLKNFIKMILICKYQINKIKLKQNKNIKKKIIYIYVNDWLLSALPIFNLYIAIILKNKGYRPIILFDRFNFYSFFKSFFVNHFLFNLITLINLKFDIEYLELNKKNKKKHNIKKNVIEKCIKFNMMRYSKEVRPKKLKPSIEKHKTLQLIDIAKNINDIINKNFKEKVIFLNAGGFLNSSFILTETLREKKQTFYTYDSAPYGKSYIIWYCKNGIAGKLEDCRASYLELKKSGYFSKYNIKKIKNEVFKEINSRKLSKDKDKFQILAKSSAKLDFKDYVIITINSGWDANSLGSDYLFKDYIEYLSKTISYIQSKFPKIKILIKDHPHKKDFKKNSSLDNYLRELKGKNIIKVDNSYNFYEILSNCKLLISIASTTISEALVLGKPAISAGKDKYYYFNLKINFKNKNDYFKNISKIIKNKKKLKSNKIESLIFYYLSQKIRLFETEINPQHYLWTKKSIKKINNSKHFRFLFKMLHNEENYFTSRVR